MTALELHIEIDLYIQQMNSAVYRKVRPEEKDRVLNNMVDKFIDGVFDESADIKRIGFQGNARRLVDIKDLLVRGRKLPLYKADEENLLYAILPPDFYYPTTERTNNFLLGSKVVPEIEKTVVWQAVIPFEEDENLYRSYKLMLGAETLFELSEAYPKLVLQETEERFILPDLVVNYLNKRSDLQVYWEEYGEEIHPNSFIFISGNPTTALEAVRVITTEEAETSYVFKPIDVERVTVPDSVKGITGNNRLTKADDLYHVLRNTLSKTTHKSPVSTISGNLLHVYVNDTFTADSVVIDYIRKPRKINLALGHDCEIRSESAQRRIVEMAGKHILRNLESQAYPSAAQENLLSQ